MSRHARPLQELQKRITDGEIGDVVLMRGYRMGGSNLGTFRSPPSDAGWRDRRAANAATSDIPEQSRERLA